MVQLLRCPLFPVAELGFGASVHSSYLAGAMACLDGGLLAPLKSEDIWATQATISRYVLGVLCGGKSKCVPSYEMYLSNPITGITTTNHFYNGSKIFFRR